MDFLQQRAAVCTHPGAPHPPLHCLSNSELIFKTRLFLFLGGQVAKLFQDSSLGNIVNILVTRLILLTEDQVTFGGGLLGLCQPGTPEQHGGSSITLLSLLYPCMLKHEATAEQPRHNQVEHLGKAGSPGCKMLADLLNVPSPVREKGPAVLRSNPGFTSHS